MVRAYVKRSGSQYIYDREYETKSGTKTYKQKIERNPKGRHKAKQSKSGERKPRAKRLTLRDAAYLPKTDRRIIRMNKRLAGK